MSVQPGTFVCVLRTPYSVGLRFFKLEHSTEGVEFIRRIDVDDQVLFEPQPWLAQLAWLSESMGSVLVLFPSILSKPTPLS